MPRPVITDDSPIVLRSKRIAAAMKTHTNAGGTEAPRPVSRPVGRPTRAYVKHDAARWIPDGVRKLVDEAVNARLEEMEKLIVETVDRRLLEAFGFLPK